jgi:hypothetical protein
MRNNCIGRHLNSKLVILEVYFIAPINARIEPKEEINDVNLRTRAKWMFFYVF